jgi:hypothetical protein
MSGKAWSVVVKVNKICKLNKIAYIYTYIFSNYIRPLKTKIIAFEGKNPVTSKFY